MKNVRIILKVMPSVLLLVALFCLATSVVKYSDGTATLSFTYFDLLLGDGGQSFSIGLLLLLLLILGGLTCSILSIKINKEYIVYSSITLCLSSGILLFFIRKFSNPSTNEFNLCIALYISAILIIISSILNYISLIVEKKSLE